MRYLFSLCVLFLFLSSLNAVQEKIVTQTITYKQGNTVLEGFLAYDSTSTVKRPGVLIFHAWNGINDYVRLRTVQVAKLGYVAFAADVYGKGIRPSTPTAAATEAAIYKKNRQLMRGRALAGLQQLQNNSLVDTNKIAVIGYCFGGTCALELGRSGAPLKGIVSFHGGLDTPTPADAKNIKGKVLILHGAADPFAPKQQVEALKKELTAANVDYKVILYPGAVHAFTDPASGNDPRRGMAYNASADHKSWREMVRFFKVIFK